MFHHRWTLTVVAPAAVRTVPFLIEALADTWGRYPLTARSRTTGWKVVWFELTARA